MGTVYPVGYSSPGARGTIDTLLQNEHTMLIDVRYSVASKRKPDWSGTALKERYGNRYLWVKELGNINYYNEGPIELFHPEIGIERLMNGLRKGYNLILLCTCSEYETCHRKVVVDLLKESLPDIEVVHPDASVDPESIPCLSIRQPYAYWICNPGKFLTVGIIPKTIENREWTTKYRGPLLIHAGVKFEHGAIEHWIDGIFPELATVLPLLSQGYPTGAIVGIADLVDVIWRSNDPWFVGSYGFVLANARPLKPIPYRGQLKLFPVPRSIVEEEVK